MKYAIYDKAADGYLTSMEFDTDLPRSEIGFHFGYNEYITKAKFLDTKESANDVVARIERIKFMDKGRFVVHSFDDTLNDQYIISEAGNPTKVVDNITVDLDGKINTKYGIMAYHWSASSLAYTINRLNRLQEAMSPIYSSWRDTFDVYKVITVTDERSCIHYQFINVTAKGLEEYAKNEEEKALVVGNEIMNVSGLLNKRIEELSKTVAVQGVTITQLRVENTNLKNKVESIKKEARNWKALYENADADREELKNVIDIIHTDLTSTTACNDLKDTLKAIHHNSGLDHISMENFLTAKDEIRSIISHVITIMESRELNQSVAFSSAEEVAKTKDIAEKIIDICDSNDDFTAQLYKFSKLYETIDNISKTTNSSFMMAFNKFLALMSTTNKSLDKILGDNIDMMIKWRSESEKLRKDLENQKKLNDANKATIAQMVNVKRAMNKELSDAADALEEVNDKNDALSDMLREITDCISDIMTATRTVDNDKMISNLTDVSLKIGVKTIDDGPIYGISVILNILIRKIKEATEWKSRTEEVICRYKAKDKEYKILKNKHEACEVVLDSTHDLLIQTRDSLAEVIFAIRNAIYNNDSDAFCCIEDRMKFDHDFNSVPFMAGVRENIKDICAAEKKKIANNDLKNSEIARLTDERDKALERAERFRGIANSVYGMTTPGRCCGKQMCYDITTGKKILVDKKKYDDLVEYIADIHLTYDNSFCMMDKPVYLYTITEYLNDLTK